MPENEDSGQARLHPLLGGAAVLVLLAVTVVAPWLRHNAAMIVMVLRDAAAVLLVAAAYRLASGVLRTAAGQRVVHRAGTGGDWFEKYRLDEAPPEPEPVTEPEPEPEPEPVAEAGVTG